MSFSFSVMYLVHNKSPAIGTQPLREKTKLMTAEDSLTTEAFWPSQTLLGVDCNWLEETDRHIRPTNYNYKKSNAGPSRVAANLNGNVTKDEALK